MAYVKIKNVEELRLRAKGHRRMQNFVAGTYGSNAEDGDPTKIEACGIGCLAAPHKKSEFAKLMQAIGVGGMWDDSSERKRLNVEFGISYDLAAVIEGGFETGWFEREFGADAEAGRADYIVALTEALENGIEFRYVGSLNSLDATPPETVAAIAERCGRPVPKWAARYTELVAA